MRIVVLLLALLALTGCERTLVETAPAEAGCDAALAGRWLSIGEGDDADGEIDATISASCLLTVVEHRKDGDRRPPPVQLATAAIGAQRMLWIDAGWANAAFDVDPNMLDKPGDLYLYGWTIKRDRLQLQPLRHRALAEKVLKREIPGDLIYQEQDLTVRIKGDRDAVATLVRRYRLFDPEERLHFRRAAAEDAP